MKVRIPSLICLLLCMLFFNLLFSQEKEVYDLYQEARIQCGDCLTGPYSFTRLSDLDEIYRYSERLGTTDNFTKGYLKSQIFATLIEANLRLMEKGKCDPVKLQRYVAALKNNTQSYQDEDDAFRNFQADSRRNRNIFGWDNDRTYFHTRIWPVYYEASVKWSEKADNAIYQYMTPDKTVRQLADFIRKTPVIRQLNGKSDQAFLVFYRKLTADGEPSTLRNFEEYIKNQMYSASGLWSTLFESQTFQTIYAKDKQNANRWAGIVNTQSVSAPLLRKVIKEAAPKEIAFVALQKLLKEIPAPARMDTLLAYRRYFQTTDDAYQESATKYSKMIEWEEMKTASAFQYEYQPLAGVEQRNNPIEYLLNPGQQRLAILPRTLDITKKVDLLKRNNKADQFVLSEQKDYNSDLVFCFDEKFPETLKAFRMQDFKLDKIASSGSFFSDYFVSYKYKIAFFVSPITYERMDTLSGRKDFNAPCIPQKEALAGKFFSEDAHKQGFHGRENGNMNTDIYYCLYDGVNWSEPHLLKSSSDDLQKTNTPFSERSPVLSEDGRYLYFSSEGHAGFGGYDVFKVPINVKTGETEGDVENLYELNSIHDELFYYPSSSETGYLSSNRTGNAFRLYSTKRSAKEPEPQPVAGTSQKDPEPEITDESSNVSITAKCELVTRDGNMEDGFIKVTGHIKYKDGKLAERAEIYFYMTGRRTEKSGTDLQKGTQEYMVLLPDTCRDILVTVNAYGKEGKMRAEFHYKLDSLCSNVNKDRIMRLDPVVTTFEDIARYGQYLHMPFFFETNRADMGIMNKFYVIQYYQDIIKTHAHNNRKFYFVGFTDERGDKAANCRLAKRRAEAVMNYFNTQLGMSSGKGKASAYEECETTEWNADDLSRIRTTVISDLRNRSKRDLELFKNRRVMVYLY